MKKYINGILGLATVAILLITIEGQRRQIVKYKQDGVIVDSLRQELFNAQAQLGRYELTQEHMKETNPKAEQEFEDYFDKQTE